MSEFIPLLTDICAKVNEIARLKFELAYYVCYNATEQAFLSILRVYEN